MHLHLHIRECVENYGSVYGFWLFSFERYNGLLGSFHTNNREVEVQLMRRFLTMSALDDLQYQMPLDFQELFYSICSEVRQTNLVDVETTKSLSWSKATGAPLVPNCSIWTDFSMIELPSRYRLCCFNSGEVLQLRSTYCKLYPSLDLHLAYLNSTYKKYSSLCVGDERLSSGIESRLYKHARVMASWVGDEGEISAGNSKPGRVKFYFNTHLILVRSSIDIALLVCSGLTSFKTTHHSGIHYLFFMPRSLNFLVLQHLSLFREYSRDLLLLIKSTRTLIC